MNRARALSAVILPALAAALLAGCAHECKMPENKVLAGASARGGGMDAKAAAEAEEKAAKDSCDALSRAALLSYYSAKRIGDEIVRPRYAAHSLWFVKNGPAEDIALWYPVQKYLDGEEVFRKAEKAWLAHLSGSRGEEPAVCRNAGAFYGLNHAPAKAEELYRRAAELAPDDPEWRKVLGMYYLRKALPGDTDLGAKALSELEKALEFTPEEKQKFYLYPDLCWAAFRAGEKAKAVKYAGACLDAARSHTRNWNYGNALHDANTVLGLAALADGDLAGAAEKLKAAADHSGSPRLSSYGPSFELAEALLERGERDAVLAYLDAVLNFWKKPDLIEAWRYKISNGQTPDFSRR